MAMPAGAYSAVVRFLVLDERCNTFRQLGSGCIIGNIGNRWAIVASASHVFEHVDDLIGLRPRQLPGFPRDESVDYRYSEEALRRVVCGIALHGQNGAETFCPVVAAEVSSHIKRRDTALAFVSLPEGMPLSRVPINLGMEPAPNEAILVAGFGAREADGSVTSAEDGAQAAAPPRDLILREGFYADYGRTIGRLQYPLFGHLIPLDSGMSGGPVMVVRPDPAGGGQWCVVAINNLSMEEPVRQDVEGESFATHMIAFYSHEVLLLPTNEWISFGEAVKRDIVFSFGPEARRVREVRSEAGTTWRL